MKKTTTIKIHLIYTGTNKMYTCFRWISSMLNWSLWRFTQENIKHLCCRTFKMIYQNFPDGVLSIQEKGKCVPFKVLISEFHQHRSWILNTYPDVLNDRMHMCSFITICQWISKLMQLFSSVFLFFLFWVEKRWFFI